jgi:hypothetical protein
VLVAVRSLLLIIWPLVVSVFINYIDRSNLAVAAPVLAPELSLNPAQLGLVFPAFFSRRRQVAGYSECSRQSGHGALRVFNRLDRHSDGVLPPGVCGFRSNAAGCGVRLPFTRGPDRPPSWRVAREAEDESTTSRIGWPKHGDSPTRFGHPRRNCLKPLGRGSRRREW